MKAQQHCAGNCSIIYRECSNAEIHYRYDARGQLSQSINARVESQHYRYDRRGWVIESERPGGRLDRYERDTSGQVRSGHRLSGSKAKPKVCDP